MHGLTVGADDGESSRSAAKVEVKAMGAQSASASVPTTKELEVGDSDA